MICTLVRRRGRLPAGLHGGFLFPPALVRRATALQRQQRRTLHQQRDAGKDLVAGHVLCQRKVRTIPPGYHQQRFPTHQPEWTDPAESEVLQLQVLYLFALQHRRAWY